MIWHQVYRSLCTWILSGVFSECWDHVCHLPVLGYKVSFRKKITTPAHHFLVCVVSYCILELSSDWEGEYHLLLQFVSVHFCLFVLSPFLWSFKIKSCICSGLPKQLLSETAPKNVIFALHPILPNLCRDDKNPLWAFNLLLFCIVLHFSSCRLCVTLCHALSDHFYPTSTACSVFAMHVRSWC